MAAFGIPGDRLTKALRSEHGIAVPTALMALLASFALASVALISSVDVQQGSTRDSQSKNAIAAADAGASVALLRLNRFNGSFTASKPCIGMSGESLAMTAASVDGWCPEVTGTVGDSTYGYRATPYGVGTMRVVATGSEGDVTRRIEIKFRTTTVGSAIGLEGLIGQDSFTLSGNANIGVGIGTNGNLVTSGNAEVCGNVRVGVGKKWEKSGNAKQCSGYGVTEGNITLPGVDTFIPSDLATNNSNYRLVTCTKTTPTKVPIGCQSDTYNGTWGTNSPFNPITRVLSASGNTALTLGGGDYFICQLSMSGNSELIMAAGSLVRIFFDTPAHCNGISTPISFSGNSVISSTGYQPKLGQYNMPGFYVLGSTTTKTSINLSGNNATNEFVLYAPNTDISLSGNSNYKGVIAGKTLNSSGNGTIKQDAGFKPPEIGGAKLYSRESYVECTGGVAPSPDANC